MRRQWFLGGLCVALCLAARVTAATVSAGPEALVAAEHAFASDAAALGVRAAFLAHLAPTAVVFAPGPVNAIKFYTRQHAGKSRLAWEPAVAVMSGAGDMGWTSGPWQWRSDSSKVEPEATGTFVTLWRRQPDGTLKAALDMGVSHDALRGTSPALESRTLAAVHGRGALEQRRGLWKADANYADVASAQGLAAALAGAAAPQVRWLRDDAVPVVGRDAARDSAAARHPQGVMSKSQAQFISASGDLGYTWGTFVEGSATSLDSSYYVHIWERPSGRPWELVLELFSRVPKGGK